MAIAFDAVSSNSASTASSCNDTHTCTGSNLGLFVGVLAIKTADNTDVLTGVTYNNVAMTRVGTVTENSNERLWLYFLANPATGSNTVAASFSVQRGSIVVHAVSYTGVDSLSEPDNANTNTSNANSITGTLTSVADNCWMTMMMRTQGTASMGTGTTNRTIIANTNNGMCDNNAAIHPAGSNTLTVNIDISTNNAAVFATFKPFIAPGTPTALSATASNGSTSLALSWSEADTNITNFRVERSDNGSTGWVEIATVAYPTTTYTDPVGSNSATKYYRVRAFRTTDSTFSSYTSNANATTAPAAPSGLTATAASNSNILTLAWTDNSSDETNWRVERSNDGSTSWAEIATSPVSGAVTTTDNVAARDTQRFYRVRAFRTGDGIYSAYTSNANATTAPANPSAIVLTASGSGMSVAWTVNSTTQTSFKVEREAYNESSYTEIGSSAATPYLDATAASETKYTYRVRAFRSGDSIYSDYATAVSGTSASPAPTLASASCVDETTAAAKVDITWNVNSIAETGFLVERSTNNASFTTVTTTAAGITTYTDTGLNANATYYYRISAVGPSGNSSPCTSVAVYTSKASLNSMQEAFLKKIHQFPS